MVAIMCDNKTRAGMIIGASSIDVTSTDATQRAR